MSISSSLNVQSDDVDFVYVDLQLYNIASNKTLPPALVYQSTRTTPFLYNSSQWEFSIIRFSLDSTTLPVFIPVIVPNQPDPDLTIYEVGLSYGDTYINQSVIWAPQNLAPTPVPPSQTANLLQSVSPYYQATSYQWLPRLVQQAFNTCFDRLVKAYPGQLPYYYTEEGAVAATAPIFSFDIDNGLATIFTMAAAYEASSVVNGTEGSGVPIKVYMNSSLYALFSSFLNLYIGPAAKAGLNFQIVVDSYNGSNTTFMPTTSLSQYPAVITMQEYSTTSVQNPVKNITFTSNTLPVQSEQISTPLIFYEGVAPSAFNTSSSNSNIANVVSDFVVPNSIYRPTIVYEPSVYRYISLYQQNSLINIDIEGFWRDQFGNLNRIYLGANSCFTMKLFFKRRGAI